MSLWPRQALDTSFDGDGKVATDLFGSFDRAWSVAVQADGSLDTSFGGSGKKRTLPTDLVARIY